MQQPPDAHSYHIIPRCDALIQHIVVIRVSAADRLFCSAFGYIAVAERPARMEEVVRGMSSSLSKPLTVKMRMGKKKDRLTAHGRDSLHVAGSHSNPPD